MSPVVRRWYCVLLLLLTASCYLCGAGYAEVSRRGGEHLRKYQILETSPDGRYAFAWGVQGRLLEFSDQHHGDNNNEVRSGDVVVNYIVDVSHQRNVTVVQGCHHFVNGGYDYLNVVWSPNGRYVYIQWDGRSHPNGLYLVTLAGSHAGQQVTLYDRFLRDVSRYLSRSLGSQRYQKLPEGRYLEARITPQNQLVVSAELCTSRAGWAYHGWLSYDLTADGRLRDPSAAPRPGRYTLGEWSLPSKDGPNIWGGEPQWGEWLIRNSRRGGAIASANIYPALRQDLLRYIRTHLPRTFLGKEVPAIYLSVSDCTADNLTFAVEVYPRPEQTEWNYAATVTYHVDWQGQHVAMVRRMALRDERTEQNHEKTRRLGIPDHPLVTE